MPDLFADGPPDYLVNDANAYRVELLRREEAEERLLDLGELLWEARATLTMPRVLRERIDAAMAFFGECEFCGTPILRDWPCCQITASAGDA